jgi:DNA-binding MarR family transcriptional regulator
MAIPDRNKVTGPMELTENQRTWNRLVTTMIIWERARNLELAKIGINMVQAEVLYCLKASKEPLTPMKLARMMHRQPHTISALVHRMEAQGLLSTKKDMKRKNWLRLSLTKKGEEALKRWSTATETPDALSVLSAKEREALNATTKKLHSEGLELLRRFRPDPYSEPLFW